MTGSFRVTGPFINQSVDMRLDFSPKQVHLEIDERQGNRTKTKRFYRLERDFRAWDLNTREVVQRKLPSGADWAVRYASAAGTALPDLPRLFLSREDAPTILGNLRNSPNLAFTSSGGSYTLQQRNGSNLVTLTLGPDHLVRGLNIKTAQGNVSWKLFYRPVNFRTPPVGFTVVDAFTELPSPPRYLSAEAQAVGEQMLRAQANLTRGVVQVRDKNGLTRLAFDGRKFAVRGPAGEWAYDARNLDFRARGIRRRGVARRREVPSYLEKGGLEVDPFLRPRLFGRIGFRDILPPEAKVRLAGKVSMGGKACRILESSAPGARFTAFVSGDGLVMSLTVENIAPGGRILNRSQRDYEIISRGQALSAAEFSLRSRSGEPIRLLR